MSWEYRYLKRTLAIPADPVLHLFEEYCEEAHGAMEAMEWSWKFRGDSCLANRVLWLGAAGRRQMTGLHVRRLAGRIGLVPEDLPGGLEAWHDLLDHHTDRAVVAYAGADPDGGRPALIKIYLTLDFDAQAAQRLLRAILPGLPGETPLDDATVMLCYAAYQDGAFSRAYLMYAQEAFDSPVVCDWLRGLAGEPAVALARTHPRAGIALKNDTTDMLGLGLRPSDWTAHSHPSWQHSPLLDPLFQAAGSRRPLRERLHRVSWITVPMTTESLALPLSMPEMNVYVKLL